MTRTWHQTVGGWTNEDDTGGGRRGVGHVAQMGQKKKGGRVQEGDQLEGTSVMGRQH